MKKYFIVILIAQLLFCSVIGADELNLNAKSAVLIDADNNRVLYSKDENVKMSIASTTKILTCIVALENMQDNQIATVSSYAAKMPKVHMKIKANEKFYLRDLLYAMMLESYNDVAVAVAENIASSKEEFADMMNRKAKEIGAVNSNFVTANGLDAANHYSTAYDMARIGAYAIRNSDFVKIIKTKQYSFYDLDKKRQFTARNRDAFLDMNNNAIGIKTGFTNKAGYCFVGATKVGDKTYVSCVLASGWPPNKSYKWKDTLKIMEYGDANYKKYNLSDFLKNNYDIYIKKGTKDKIRCTIHTDEKLLLSEKDKVSVRVIEDYKMPIDKNQRVGKLEIFINNRKEYEMNLKSPQKVYKFNYLFCLKKSFKHFMGH